MAKTNRLEEMLAELGQKMDQLIEEMKEQKDELSEEFQEQMDMCKCCDHYLDQYRHTIQLTKEIDEISVPSELAEHTLAFLRKSNAFASDQDAASS